MIEQSYLIHRELNFLKFNLKQKGKVEAEVAALSRQAAGLANPLHNLAVLFRIWCERGLYSLPLPRTGKTSSIMPVGCIIREHAVAFKGGFFHAFLTPLQEQ